MKRILITGANSYIGTSFENYLKQWPDQYKVDTMDMVDGSWRKKSFAGYDVIFHVAGIAHSDTKKVNDERKALYYKVNTELAIETAKKAKTDGVKQFIFMSSAIVYGDSAPIGEKKVITKDTVPCPSNFYGDSKLQAENGIRPLQDNNFNVVILRPPMIYGKGCKGNYPLLSKYAKKLFIFPYINNERSMIYIQNLLDFVRIIIEKNEHGIFWPQNNEYSNTSIIIKEIGIIHGNNIHLIRGFTWMFKLVSLCNEIVNKAFGNFTYDKSISQFNAEYCNVNLNESLVRTEQDG